MKKILFFVLGVAVVSGLIMKPDTGHNTVLQIVLDKPGVQLASDDFWNTIGNGCIRECGSLKSGLIMTPPPPAVDDRDADGGYAFLIVSPPPPALGDIREGGSYSDGRHNLHDLRVSFQTRERHPFYET